MHEMPHEEHAERRRTAILEAAEQLLAIHGFDALRLRDVAKQAGVSIGMIQHYFVTRDELLRATIRAASERRVAEWSELGSGDGDARSQLSALLEGALDNRHRCIVWLETCAAATRHDELKGDVLQTQTAWRSALKRVIELGTSRGEFQPQTRVDDTVSILVSLIDGLMLAVGTARSGQDDTRERTRLLQQVGAQLLGGVTAQTGVSAPGS